MTKLFISYSRRDWAVAEGLVENLANFGLGVWIDTKIGPRLPFSDEIDKAIREADVVIVIWSPNSVRSDWVRWEAGEALKSGRLLQLRVNEIKPSEVPAPFNEYNIYGDGEPEDIKRLVDQMVTPDTSLSPPEFPNPRPLRPHPGFSDAEAVKASSGYVLSIAAVASGLLLYPVSDLAGSVLFAVGLVAGVSLLAYSLYFSVARFADRFGHIRIIEALMVGVLAGAFAGVVGGYDYASRRTTVKAMIPDFDLFTIKYVRVIVISTIVGMALSYLIVAMLRYASLRERNLGPVWSRRRIFWNIAVPIVLTLALTVGTPIITATLPRTGQFFSLISGGYLDWFGSGQCHSIKYCADVECSNCQVGNMSRIDPAFLLGIYLWTIHIYHLRQAGGRLKRMLVSSIVLTLAVLAVMFTFQLFPDKIPDEEVLTWRAVAFAVPSLMLIGIAIGVVYLNARSLERAEILKADPS